MWDCAIQSLDRGRSQRFVLRRDGSAVPYRDVLRFWREDESFRSSFISLLAKSPYSAFRWETPPVTTTTAARDFEFVLLDAPRLARSPDPEAFAEHFRVAGTDSGVVAFPNLRKDAVLIVPRPSGPLRAYVHLAVFVREAPAAQVHELLRVVGMAMERRLSTAPTWLSTAGMGVPWLHVRLDSQPKYYGYAPYRDTGEADRSSVE